MGRNRKAPTLSRREDELPRGLHIRVHLRQQVVHTALDGGIDLRRAPDRHLSDMVAAAVVANDHVERGSGGALLAITLDGDPVEFGAAEEEALQLVGVAAVVEVDVAVRGEEGVEGGVGEGVRVGAGEAEDHEVGDVDDAGAERGRDALQVLRCAEDFEHEVRADADEDDVWGRGARGRRAGEFPLAAAGFAVRFCFGGVEPYWLGCLRADDEIDVVLGAEAVGECGEEGVGVRGQVDSCCCGFEVEDCADEGRVLV